jgi:outer membrane protein
MSARRIAACVAASLAVAVSALAQNPASAPSAPPASAQTPTPAPSPSPALPNLNLPALSPAPTQRNVPPGPQTPGGPAQQVTAPDVAPITGHVDTPEAPSPQLERDAGATTLAARDSATGITPNFLRYFGPYRAPVVPPLFPGTPARLESLIRDGKLYLTLQDAIALALENNLDVEAERYDLGMARTDEVRAAGGGSTRGLDFSIAEPPNGVGGPGSPLLNTTTVNSNPTTPTVTDLTSLNSTAQQTMSLSQMGQGISYSPGPNVPLFDPQLLGEAAYLRRSETVQLGSTGTTTGTTTGTGGTGSGGTVTTQPGALNYVELNAAYLQGFSTGLQLEAIVNNSSSVLYGSNSQYDPFHSPSTSTTLTQPLLRGRGLAVNRRYIRIARTDRRISRLLFEQQVLDSIYGVSRIYYDLASLGENVLVKQEALRAATKQREDEEEQEKIGTLAPIDLTQAVALESSSQFDLIQAQGLYRQEEVILRNLLLRTASPVFTAQFNEIVPTDRILVPDRLEPLDVPELIRQGLAQRPDLAQAKLQIETGRINTNASRNGALPQLNVYANVETRGAAEQPYEQLGSPGTGVPTTPQDLAVGGLRTSTIYQGGIQVTLPLRNRVAESDAARDQLELRQVQARTEKLSAQVREEIETAVIALETSQAAYQAATKSRQYQEQLLDAEEDKLSVGQSTDLAVLQNEAYLAQARSTEIAARSNWMKARLELDHAVGNLLEKNHIELDDAIKGKLP